ncbi:hypothetical protein CBR_g46186 [Chara braunii]|uniref:CCHC-type domain-containing protein n=1 Tax=Chara braunii TaxID=69332 RepID=A0A388M009_CHABU|nr:hypothetical protein CBR_g46186 [Chara braunii]|eukprot:GBG87886.1 hypothetical protein CBR_g46186 [Chara braunii]
MASNLQASTIVRTCYNCGDPGHFSRWCPHRNGGQTFGSQPLLTLPSNSSVSLPSSSSSGLGLSGQFRNNGWYEAKQRLILLEDTVAEIKSRHDAEVEKEKNLKEEEDRKKRTVEDNERREKDRKEREDMHKRMMNDMNEKWEKMCGRMTDKKDDSKGLSEMEQLRREIEGLKGQMVGPAASTSTQRATAEGDEVVRQLLKEQENMKARLEKSLASQKRLESLEADMALMRTMRDEALQEVETWKNEALRPGNKRGCAAVTPSPVTRTQSKTNTEFVGMVHRHSLEVEKLKELRVLDFNARREKEQENEKLKIAMDGARKATMEREQENERLKVAIADLEATQREPCTNLRWRMNEMASRSTGLTKKKTVTNPLTARALEKQQFVKDQRKDLATRKMMRLRSFV